MNKPTTLLAPLILLLGMAQSVNAGTYLFYLQNDSGSTVKINAKLPFGWVDTPKYPLTVESKEVLADERAYDEAKKSWDFYNCVSKRRAYKVEKIRNLALPTSCDEGPNDVWVSINGPKDYRISICKNKILVRQKIGNSWKDQKKIDFVEHGGIGAFWIQLDSHGGIGLIDAVNAGSRAQHENSPWGYSK